jgi:hypothetical protein
MILLPTSVMITLELCCYEHLFLVGTPRAHKGDLFDCYWYKDGQDVAGINTAQASPLGMSWEHIGELVC